MNYQMRFKMVGINTGVTWVGAWTAVVGFCKVARYKETEELKNEKIPQNGGFLIFQNYLFFG